MTDRERLLEQLRADEGFGRHPYRDTVGKLTIGYGRNLDDVGLSEAEARFLLDNDITVAVDAVFTRLPWHVHLNAARRAVLYAMAFNLGIGGVLKFRKMLAAAEASDCVGAAREMLDSKWAGQVGDRARRLAEQMETGRWN